MEILLLRHGRTAGNIARRYIGRTDEPLCPEGIEHAKNTGFDDSVLSVYVSPMKRALETAKLKFPNAGHILCAGLREMDFGDFEGRSADEMADDETYRRWVDSGCTLPCPGGEQMDSFGRRVCRAFDGIVRENLGRGERRAIITAHGGTIMAILSRYGVPQRQYYEWYAENCGGYRARLDEKTWAHSPALTNCVRFDRFGDS